MSVYYEDERVTLHHGKCEDVLRELPDGSVDAVVTDPPYGLEFMGKDWDAPWRDSSRWRAADPLPGSHSTNPTPRPQGWGVAGRPFQQWCEQWATECLRVLKPGGHLLAFGGTRTWHRLACAVEDAGFEVRDSIAWLNGSGFPKSLDVSKAIDKAAGAEREVVGNGTSGATAGMQLLGPSGIKGGVFDVTAPATDDARTWQGWGTALKPGFEPVVCARKPFNAVPLWGKVNRLHHSIGALLWLSLSPAKRAGVSSPSSPAEQHVAWCVSARVSAATDTSPDGFAETGTCNSPALASTSSSIASSWSGILAALSDPTRMSTTSTASSTTTALRTLSSLLGPITSQTTMPPCGCLLDGSASPAQNAATGSTDEWANWLHTLSASVPATATEGIALAAASALAQVAASLSDDLGAGSSAAQSATTGAAASSSPAFEPIVVARKPLVGTVASNVLTHGTGALNIDACRVGTDIITAHGGGVNVDRVYGGGRGIPAVAPGSNPHVGRWPANVLLDGSQADSLDEMSGESTSPPVGSVARTKGGNTIGTFAHEGREPSPNGHGDKGGASRFFPTFRYEPKAPADERPRANGIAHPTVKPLDLMRWLVRLVTPPGGTVLEPFAGSGTTAEACILEGFRCIAIEREADYLPLITNRLNRRLNPAAYLAATRAEGDDDDLLSLLNGEAS